MCRFVVFKPERYSSGLFQHKEHPMRAHVHILRKSVPLRPSDCSHGKAMRQSASTSHCFPPPMYTISNQAARCASVTSFALAKLAGFANSAYSIEQAQSQTRNAHSDTLAPLCISHTQLVKAANGEYLFASPAIVPVWVSCCHIQKCQRISTVIRRITS